MEKDILWFNVSVDDVAVVENLVACAEVPKEAPDEFFGAVVVVVDVLLKGAPIAIFHDEVEIVLAGDLQFKAVD